MATELTTCGKDCGACYVEEFQTSPVPECGVPIQTARKGNYILDTTKPIGYNGCVRYEKGPRP